MTAISLDCVSANLEFRFPFFSELIEYTCDENKSESPITTAFSRVCKNNKEREREQSEE